MPAPITAVVGFFRAGTRWTLGTNLTRVKYGGAQAGGRMDRVAVVVGGASGIGAACVQALAEDGCRVVVADVADGADVRCDVTSEDAVTALFDGVVASH